MIAKKPVAAIRMALQRSAWINNIIRVLGVTREHAERLYDKIKPHEENN